MMFLYKMFIGVFVRHLVTGCGLMEFKVFVRFLYGLIISAKQGSRSGIISDEKDEIKTGKRLLRRERFRKMSFQEKIVFKRKIIFKKTLKERKSKKP